MQASTSPQPTPPPDGAEAPRLIPTTVTWPHPGACGGERVPCPEHGEVAGLQPAERRTGTFGVTLVWAHDCHQAWREVA